MLHEFRRWRARRPVVMSGLPFINAILANAGRPSIDESTYDSWRRDLLNDADMAAAFDAARPVLCRLSPQKADRFKKPFDVFLQDHGTAAVDTFYILIRALAPERMVETGVHTGYTTSLIVAAMSHGRFGHLTSIDLPSSGGMEHIRIDETETGVLVPLKFRNRWTLIRDNTLYALPSILRDVAPSVFFHDSNHSYAHMAFEYGLAVSHLPVGGVLISDDTTINSAFYDMAGGIGVKHLRHVQNLNFSVCIT